MKLPDEGPLNPMVPLETTTLLYDKHWENEPVCNMTVTTAEKPEKVPDEALHERELLLDQKLELEPEKPRTAFGEQPNEEKLPEPNKVTELPPLLAKLPGPAELTTGAL